MELNKNALIEYFNYDLEKLLNEFNNYYVLKATKLPLYIQTLFLYFSHLAENSLQLLINNKYNYQNAIDVINVPNIYIKPYNETEINNFLNNYRQNPQIFYGLAGYPLYFFTNFLAYVKYNQEKGLNLINKNIPNIEHNLNLIRKYII
jgi:hypothetical protein